MATASPPSVAVSPVATGADCPAWSSTPVASATSSGDEHDASAATARATRQVCFMRFDSLRCASH
ncbi:hypothetical protein [Erythrobacter litoralis]|uniref:hypothetical protein n=1 Tax=Erythrobacter litoralis TaxID=39960 RepID=UPI003AEF244F